MTAIKKIAEAFERLAVFAQQDNGNMGQFAKGILFAPVGKISVEIPCITTWDQRVYKDLQTAYAFVVRLNRSEFTLWDSPFTPHAYRDETNASYVKAITSIVATGDCSVSKLPRQCEARACRVESTPEMQALRNELVAITNDFARSVLPHLEEEGQRLRAALQTGQGKRDCL